MGSIDENAVFSAKVLLCTLLQLRYPYPLLSVAEVHQQYPQVMGRITDRS